MRSHIIRTTLRSWLTNRKARPSCRRRRRGGGAPRPGPRRRGPPSARRGRGAGLHGDRPGDADAGLLAAGELVRERSRRAAGRPARSALSITRSRNASPRNGVRRFSGWAMQSKAEKRGLRLSVGSWKHDLDRAPVGRAVEVAGGNRADRFAVEQDLSGAGVEERQIIRDVVLLPIPIRRRGRGSRPREARTTRPPPPWRRRRPSVPAPRGAAACRAWRPAGAGPAGGALRHEVGERRGRGRRGGDEAPGVGVAGRGEKSASGSPSSTRRPCSITAMRPQYWAARPRSWVIRIIAMPRSRR